MSEIINLDHQASTPLAPGVLEAMLPHFTGPSPNPHSSHILGAKSNQDIDKSRQCIADLLNVDSTEIYFTSGASEANNLAILGTLQHVEQAGLVTSKIEHKCVLATARHLEVNGAQVSYVSVDSEGYIDFDELDYTLKMNRPNLVSVMMANNEIGTIQDIKKVSEICRGYGTLLHSDMAQCLTHTALDLNKLGVDMASFSSHKMNGPKGIGALYVSHAVRNSVKPIIHGGGQENGLRSGTLPTALCVGFGRAAEYWSEEGSASRKQIMLVRDALWKQLSRLLPDARLIGPSLKERHIGNLNVHIPGVDAELLLGMLQREIAASTGSACTSGIPEPSHVIHALSDEAAIRDGSIRLSMGTSNTTAQCIEAASLLADCVTKMSE